MLKGKKHTLKLVSRKGSTKKSNKLRKNYNCRIKTERCTRLSRMVELKSPKGRTKRRTLTAKAIAAAATAKKRKKRKMLKKNKPRTRNKRVMVKPPSTLQKEAKL